MIKALLSLLILSVMALAQIPYTFKAGDVAKAAEVNENLVYIMGRIDSLIKVVDTLKSTNDILGKRVDTLKSNNDTLEKLIDKAKLPIGSILATMVQTDTSSGIWVLADGRTATTEYFQATGENKVPDLRGLFLRGLNAGRSDGIEDPEGVGRTAGSFQADTLKSHSHLENLASGNGGVHSGGSYGVINQVQTGKTGGAETRPRNSAVYWYVKVKP